MALTAKQQLKQKLNESLLVGQTAAKWLPREKSSKSSIAQEIRDFFGMSPRQYRKQVAELTKVVEQQMCFGEWNEINFSHVPSLAAARYQKAFGRNAPVAYNAYKEALKTGAAKVNAGAVYPHDVIRSIKLGDAAVAAAQWGALPNYMSGANVLPMVDVSGSMNCAVGRNPNLQCIDISVALGLYCADKNRGAFKDMFLTFSEKTKLEVLRGDILSKYAQMNASDWGMSTNLHGAFDQVLRVATTQKVPAEDMPKYILILSDMQFDHCTKHDDSAMAMIERKYEAAGYAMPKIVFWNLNSNDNVPVAFNKHGVALISGFSPAIMKSVLAAAEFTPRSIMLDTINVPRYTVIE